MARRYFTALALVALGCLAASAITVQNKAGQLMTKVTDHTVTSLTVTGTMDVRDFMFVSSQLDQLVEVDLSGTSIVAYKSDDAPLMGLQYEFEADVLPPMSFFGKPLTRVVLPSNLRAISYATFSGCRNLAAIAIPAGVDSIGSYAFSATSLGEVTLGTVSLGDGAFAHCEQLAKVTMAAGVVGKEAFYGDAALTDVTMGSGVTSVGERAFAGCTAMTAVKWGGGSRLASIGEAAFANSGVTDANLSDFNKLGAIGEYAYANTPIASATLPANFATISEGTYFYASQLQEVTIPSAVTFIGSMAMAGNTGLKEITTKAVAVPALGDNVWALVDQPNVKLNAFSTDYREADQWKEFNVEVAYFQGDVNLDGKVNSADVSALVNAILGGESADDNPFADVNLDGMVNSADVSQVMNFILSGSSPVIHPVPALTVKYNEIIKARAEQQYGQE